MLPKKEIARLHRLFPKKEDFENAREFYENYETRANHDFDFNYMVTHMATKEDMRDLESRFDDLKENFSKIVESVDKLTGLFLDLRQEMAFSGAQCTRQVEWNHKVGKKVGIPFDY